MWDLRAVNFMSFPSRAFYPDNKTVNQQESEKPL